MAITILQSPTKYHSGYNPVRYKLDSTKKTEIGFRYMVRIKDYNTTNVLAEYSIAPDPLESNYGNVDISRILQNKLDTSLPTSSNSSVADKSFYRYDIEFGESYNKEWAFNDYIFLPGGALGLTTSTAYGAGFSDVPHGFTTGDQIKVRTNSNYLDNRDLLNSFFEVTVVDTKTIKINDNYAAIGAFPATPGKVTFADGRKVIDWNLASDLNKVVVNTAMDVLEYSLTGGSLSTYTLTSPASQILTDQPERFSATPDQSIYFNFIVTSSGSVTYFKNDTGDILYKVNSGTHQVYRQGVGPANLGSTSLAAGTNPLIKPTTKYYDVWVEDNVGARISQEYRITLDRRCTISDAQVLFLDRKGSFNSFSFQLRQKEMVNTKKEKYNQFTEGTTTSAKGETIYHSSYDKSLSLKTNFMGEQMNFYFEQLLTSRHTYVLWEGVLYACTVNEGTFENEFERNNKFITKAIDLKFALNSPVN